MKHAAPEQIVAFRDGELIDHEVGSHIRNCPLCRRQLGEARWVRTHTQSHVLMPTGPTPTRDEIAAYLDEALDQQEMARVETHLRADEHCLAIFDQLLMMSLKLKDPIPSAEYVDALKTRLREPKLLGKLRVFVTDRFKQVFHPARPGESALGRAMKMVTEESGVLPCMEASASFCEQRAEDEGFASSPPPPPGPSNPRLIDTGRWLIRAVSSGTDGDAILELRIEDAQSGDPVPGIVLMLEPGWDDPVHALTDENGSVRLPLPEGDSRLEIGEGPELVLEISAELDSE